MTTTYFQQRLRASLRLMKAAIDPCAKIAHEGMARGYRAILAARSLAEENKAGWTERDSEFAIQRWANEGGADARWRPSASAPHARR